MEPYSAIIYRKGPRSASNTVYRIYLAGFTGENRGDDEEFVREYTLKQDELKKINRTVNAYRGSEEGLVNKITNLLLEKP